jgi:hypothetical protein
MGEDERIMTEARATIRREWDAEELSMAGQLVAALQAQTKMTDEEAITLLDLPWPDAADRTPHAVNLRINSRWKIRDLMPLVAQAATALDLGYTAIREGRQSTVGQGVILLTDDPEAVEAPILTRAKQNCTKLHRQAAESYVYGAKAYAEQCALAQMVEMGAESLSRSIEATKVTYREAARQEAEARLREERGDVA